ncbi:MAG: DUF1700 domain-containing protein [Lachnospiraceae bacterium]|nr:DUF1700 domain-containing protein [Lachnospiraceae bacterium]
MTRYEFLDGLKEALLDAPADIRQENIQYYASYIEEEIGKGRTEEEVLEELGEPSWIANSIREAASGDTSADAVSYEYEEIPDTGPIYREYREETGSDGEMFTANINGKIIYLKKWMVIAICAAAAILLLLLLSFVFSAVFRVLIWLLTSPFFWIVAIALLVMGFIRSR